ncbi:MAG: TonB-dependent receptor [Cyanobacteria bacterium J06581_3]
MTKKFDNKIALQSGVVSALSIFSLVVGATQAQAEQTFPLDTDSTTGADQEDYGTGAIALQPALQEAPQQAILATPRTNDTLIGLATVDEAPEPAQTLVPVQTIPPEADWADQPEQVLIAQSVESESFIEPAAVVAPEVSGAIPGEVTVAESVELPSEADVAAEENERLVTLALEKEEDNVVFPRPNWQAPAGDLLITLADEDEDEEEDEEDANGQVPLISLNLGEEDEDEDEAQSDVPQVALLPTAANSDRPTKREGNWIALFDSEPVNSAPENITSEQSEVPKNPLLALSTPDDENEDTVNSSLIAVNPEAAIPDKRSADWISLTPPELTAPGNVPTNEVAISTPEPSASSDNYDLEDLSLVAITPTYLANGEESQVAVGSSEVEFLSPEADAFLDIASTPVVLRFPIGAKIALLANGSEVDTSLVGRTETNNETGQRTQTWYGVSLLPGENVLEVVSTDTGEVLQSLPLTVRGLPTELVLLTPRSIPSDGRSTSTIRGQLLDEAGNISLWGNVATLNTSDGQFIGADYDVDAPGFQVLMNEGEFVAELQSSLESHLVQLQAKVGEYEAFSQIQFVTPQRSNLISGVVDLRLGARGTDFYDSYREFLPLDGDNSYEFDVEAAVFATGNVGEWLYTGAYNSDRSLNENCRGESSLFRGSSGDCDTIYPTYGDDSYSDVVAPSLDSVYLRFERNSPSNPAAIDYAMWGDFNTQEFATPAQLFTSTTRQLHGFKANYNFGNLAATGLYANNVEGFERDTIAPDGTSGFYFTSQRNIVAGSESVYLETEELERPGIVIDRQQLARGVDYDIDYDRGSLLFSDPILRTAVDSLGQLLVRRIVTTYQYEDGTDTDILAGRLQYTFDPKPQRASWVGASYFSQDQGNRDFSLYGVDARVSLGENAQLTAEAAQSSHDFDGTGTVNGGAYRVELEGSLGGLNGRTYFRTTDPGFSNSATTSFVPGQTRYGAQLSGQLGSTTSVRAQFDQENNFGTTPRIDTSLSPLLSGLTSTPGERLDNSLTTYSVGLTQKLGNSTAEIDWIHRDRTDRLTDLGTVSSDQLRSRFTTPLARNLTLVAQNELNLSSDVDPIYPSRTLVGINWEAMPGLNVGLNQIFYGGGGNNRGNSTSLDITGQHTFASDTTVRGRFSTVDGRQIGGSIGLEQGINLAPGLDLDLGYEKVFSTLGNQTAAGTQLSRSVTTGSGASALALSGGESYSIGLSYTDSADFQASSSFEHRSSSTGSNTVFNLSAVGRLNPALTILGDYRLAQTANPGLRGAGTSSLLKLGLAYRDPEDDRFNGLLRYEHRMNPNSLPNTASLGASTTTQEHLFSAEGIYTPNWRWELYGKYAFRNSSTDISGTSNDFSGNSSTHLAQARATYRLGYHWDVVGEARWLGGNGYNEVGYSVEAGYYPLPDLRLSAGYSGGATDYDFGENRSAGGFYVGATAKLSGLLNGFRSQPIAPVQSSESVIQVSDETVIDVTTGDSEIERQAVEF